MANTEVAHKRFQTLLLREWMQHGRGWLILMAVPLLLATLLLTFGSIHIDGPEDGAAPPAAALAGMAMLATPGLLLAIVWLATVLQASGLARRDQQDRSIEFWLSLPVGHTQSITATLLMHWLLMPWLAVAVGMLGGQVMALLLVAKLHSVGAWLALPWGALLMAALAFAARMALGSLLALLWLSPLLLAAMAASAWLKRWGLPALIASVALVGLVADKFYGTPIVWNTLQALGLQAAQAFHSGHNSDMKIVTAADATDALHLAPAWALEDGLGALQALVSPLLVGALLVAAAGFMLLALRRRRGA